MTNAEIWLVIFGGMILTYLTRLFFIALIPHDRMPTLFRRSLLYVSPAVLSAIIVPALLWTGSEVDLSLGNDRLMAGVIAALVAWRFKSPWLTILVGMITLWVLSAIG